MKTEIADRRPEGWWRSAVVYQVYPRSFQDSNGDGVGDLPGITSRLDHLSDLGVDVVWLSPVYRSPQLDNGYDISDYQDIDPLFGTLADVDALIAALHARGMKLMMDLVVNHTSDQHPWFVESRDPASPRRDWYFWRPARPGRVAGTPGAEPDEHPAAFGGSRWIYDPSSGEYYLGLFSPGQPDLNWENADVRRAVYEMMLWWVDRGVDGFRMDVINLISKPLAITKGGPVAPTGFFELGSRLDEFLAEMNREVGLDEQNLITVGEMPGSTVQTAIRATDPSRHELNMVFTFEHVDLDTVPGGRKWDLADLPLPVLKHNLEHWQKALESRGLELALLGQSRPAAGSLAVRRRQCRTPRELREDPRLGTAPAQGHPVHLPGRRVRDDQRSADRDRALSRRRLPRLPRRGHRGGHRRGRRPALARTKQPRPCPYAGAVGRFVECRIHHRNAGDAVNPNHTINAAADRQDPDSVFAHYRRLIALRHEDETVRAGRFDLLLPEHDQLWAFTRTLGDDVLLVLANCSSQSADIPATGLPSAAGATLMLGTHPGEPSGTLAPWESRILRLA